MWSALAVFIDQPLLALVPAALFILLFAATRSRWSLVAAGMWAGYAVYEYGMKARILCSGECNIRIDLLFVYPVLILCSGAAVFLSLRRRKANRGRLTDACRLRQR